MQKINKDYLPQFRAPQFPGSYLISFEGIEGAGKSTQIIRLKDALEAQNFRVLVLREPGGTSFGEKLRHAILENRSELSPLAEAHLFASSRAQLLIEVTLKELNVPNTIIIYDRYLDSSIAYQGIGRGLGVNEILQIHQTFPLTLVPHLTFYLKIKAETSELRQKIRNAPKDYFESKGPDFYKKLVSGYDLLLDLFPERIQKVDAEKSPEEIHHQIMSLMSQLLLK